jgi:hypothetical protein
MTELSDGIQILPGTTRLLAVAPHGPVINGKFENDVRTGIVVRELHRLTGCSAIINDRFFKPKGPVKKDAQNFFLDLYRVDHARKVSQYFETIKAVADSKGRTLVLWVHGIFDHFALDRGKEHMDLGLFPGLPGDLHALIAYGQGGDPKTGNSSSCFSARQQTVDTFLKALNQQGMNAVFTHPDCNNYRGRDAKRFNQYFVQNGYDFDRVESIQLEIKETGFRDSEANAVKTAQIIASALKKIS